MENPNWIPNLGIRTLDTEGIINRAPLYRFLSTIEPLGLTENDISGTILVMGPANFAERVLVGTPDSRFTTLRSAVKKLVLLEPDAYRFILPIRNLYGPKVSFVYDNQNPVDQTPFEKGELSSKITLIAGGNDTLPRFPEKYFDVITFFRVPNIMYVINRSINQISRTLKTGGKFIGSGDVDEEDLRRLSHQNQMDLVALKKLHNPDIGYQIDNHRGFIVKKT